MANVPDKEPSFRWVPDWDTVFELIDLDGDDRVDFHEFYAATINHQLLFSKQNIEKIFNCFDIDDKGYISMNDF